MSSSAGAYPGVFTSARFSWHIWIITTGPVLISAGVGVNIAVMIFPLTQWIIVMNKGLQGNGYHLSWECWYTKTSSQSITLFGYIHGAHVSFLSNQRHIVIENKHVVTGCSKGACWFNFEITYIRKVHWNCSLTLSRIFEAFRVNCQQMPQLFKLWVSTLESWCHSLTFWSWSSQTELMKEDFHLNIASKWVALEYRGFCCDSMSLYPSDIARGQ